MPILDRKSIQVAGCVLLATAMLGCRSTRSYIERGNQLYAAGKYEDAVLNYRNAIKRDSRSGEAYYRLAKALEKLDRGAEVYQDLNQAATFSPDNVPAKVELASLCLASYLRDPRHPAVLYKQAKSLTDDLLARNPNSPEGLRLKGSISLVDSKPSEAVKAFQQALRSAPDSRELPTDLAEALLKDNQIEEGERMARTAIAKNPKYAPPYELLYSFYATHGRAQDAEALLKLWMANSPDDPAPGIRLAAEYYRAKKPEEAEKMLDAMVQRQASVPQVDLAVGDFHALIRNWEKALADYQRGQSRDAAHALVYQGRQAGVLASMGKRDEAVKLLNAVLAKDPRDIFARNLKVQILFQLGGSKNLDEAAELASDLAKESPGNSKTQMMAGQVLMAKGNLDAAVARFQQAAAVDAQSAAPHLALAQAYMVRKNYSAMLEQAAAALAILPEDQTARLYRVIALTALGSIPQAKTEAEQLARSTKNAAPVEMQLGMIALKQKNYSEAEAHFRKLYKEGDPNPYPLMGLVNSYLGEHQPDRAMELVEAELKRTPQSSAKASLVIDTAEVTGKPDIAMSELQKMVAQNPKSADVQIRLAEFHRHQGNFSAALEAFQRARQLDPKRKGVDALIGSMQDALGQKKEAIASYRKALAETPDDPVTLNNLAVLLADTGGDLNEALRLATAASRKLPNNLAVEDTLAWIHIKRGNATTVVPVLERLTNRDPANATYRYHYGVALFEKGDRTSAKQQLQAALSDKPAKQTESDIRNLLAKLQ